MKVLCLGEILMRLTVPSNKRWLDASSLNLNFGGSELNVGIALAQMGAKTTILSRLPDNAITDAIVAKIKSFSVNTEFILKGGERTGIYFLEEGNSIRSSKIIYDRKNTAICHMEPEMVDWDAVFDGVDLFHWSGITTSLSKKALETCQHAVKTAKDKGIKVSCDLHFRKNSWDFGIRPADVMPQLISQADVVVSDPFTFEKLTHTDLMLKEGSSLSDSDIHECFKLQAIAFPKVKTWAMLSREIKNGSHNILKGLILHNNEFSKANQQEIYPIVDRIGGGDAFMAGLLYGLHHYKNPETVISYATAASALKHTIPGDYLLASVEEIEELMSGAAPGAIKR
jgi:2-dehydro-3-deoxygluconokinase